MASAYAKDFSIPADFPEILRDFTREVLRDQPADVSAYGYHYFMEQIKKREVEAEKGGGGAAR